MSDEGVSNICRSLEGHPEISTLDFSLMKLKDYTGALARLAATSSYTRHFGYLWKLFR
jgi:hypothetical protein